jgi:hypothetical protein
MAGPYRLKQAVCHEPHHKQQKVKGKAQEHVPERWTKEDRVHNTETRDNDGIDNPSIDIRFRNANKITEARKDS